MSTASRPIASIKVGRRHRRDMGAAGIAETGLLQPANGKLICAQRRLEAFKFLKRSKIPVTVVPLGQTVHGELGENTQRKNFTPSENDSIRRAMLLLEKQRRGSV